MEVEGYENYLIYPDGKVQNKKSKRYLLPQTGRHGYLEIGLCKDGNRKLFLVHRLVGTHYIPNPENKICLDHINRDKTDNRVENLRWATYSENGQNREVSKNNKLGIKNIHYDKSRDRYYYQKVIRGQKQQKRLKTLEEAIEYKKNIENILKKKDIF